MAQKKKPTAKKKKAPAQMGRPPKYTDETKPKAVTVYLPSEQHKTLKHFAAHLEISSREVVQRALEFFFEKNRPKHG